MKKFLRPRTVLAAVLFALLAFLLGAVLWNRGHARRGALCAPTKPKKRGKTMLQFNHFNFNVLDLERSLAFYRQALELEVAEEKEAGDGSFKLVYLGDGETGFRLELTWLRDRTEPYDLGEQEFHLAFVTDRFDALLARHRAMGCVCFENPDMGVYFIEDPDGYWIELVPERG